MYLELQLEAKNQIFLNAHLEEDIARTISEYFSYKIKVNYISTQEQLADTPQGKKEALYQQAQEKAYLALSQDMLLQKLLKTFQVELTKQQVEPSLEE